MCVCVCECTTTNASNGSWPAIDERNKIEKEKKKSSRFHFGTDRGAAAVSVSGTAHSSSSKIQFKFEGVPRAAVCTTYAEMLDRVALTIYSIFAERLRSTNVVSRICLYRRADYVVCQRMVQLSSLVAFVFPFKQAAAQPIRLFYKTFETPLRMAANGMALRWCATVVHLVMRAKGDSVQTSKPLSCAIPLLLLLMLSERYYANASIRFSSFHPHLIYFCQFDGTNEANGRSRVHWNQFPVSPINCTFLFQFLRQTSFEWARIETINWSRPSIKLNEENVFGFWFERR